MQYKKGYKYQLTETMRFKVDIKASVKSDFIQLDANGNLKISKGYAWDGASFIKDRQTNMRASLVHDALYQLMREGHINFTRWREADLEFDKLLKIDGAWNIIRKLDMAGLWLAQGKHAHPDHRKHVLTAP